MLVSVLYTFHSGFFENVSWHHFLNGAVEVGTQKFSGFEVGLELVLL